MNACEVKADNSNKILEKEVSCKINSFFKENIGTTKHEHHINNSFTLIMLLIISCIVDANSVDKPQLKIKIGDRSNDKKCFQIIN